MAVVRQKSQGVWRFVRGDLLFRNPSGKCAIRDSRDCWDCAACVKACPRQAIEMVLPAQIGGRGSTLKAHQKKNTVMWTLTKPDGTFENFEILVKTTEKES